MKQKVHDVSNAELDHRLKALFGAILDLPVDQVGPELSTQSCERWDSLNQIHLTNAIEEEFGFAMDFEDQMRMLTYDIALEIVSRHGR